MERLMTTGEVAKSINRSTERVRQLEREGRLPAQKTRSGLRLFRPADVALLAQQLGEKPHA